ncbi:20356_t:CDS:2 [Gigaspora margarita]|uniref:20356_t:CDS:1 n=1 Tax=Gigaspora margarita TaxID=4874 RepID=A0ABN7VW50_GIGMA|nr:20356_t:CDS:2 [Gigaspora margarita]
MSVLLKTANVVGFLALVAIAVFLILEHFPSSNSQNNSQNATNSTETYLMPEEFTFGIWFLIFPLLLGFIIYQWFSSADDVPKGPFDNLLIVYPFSMLTAWNLYVLFLYFWIAIPAINSIPLTVVALAFLSISGLYIVDYYGEKGKKDNIFPVSIIWILVGIAVKNVETMPVYTTALAGIGLIVGGIFRNWFTFSTDWYSSFRFIETGGEYGSSYRNFRTEEPFGQSGHYMPELYNS